MICKQCGEEKATWWFSSEKATICLNCEVLAEQNNVLEERIRQRGFQTEAPQMVCAKCNKPGGLAMFRHERYGRSLLCKICEQIISYRQIADSQAAQKAEEDRRNLEAVPIKGYESNKRERYTIKCERCKEKRNPQEVRVLGAICEFCWRPEEKVEAGRMQDKWDRSVKKR